MAKAATAVTPADLKNVLPPDVKVISVPHGATVEVDVDVNEMTIPYTIAMDGRVLIKALVDRRETVPAPAPGSHRLGWGFMHTEKGWSHTLTLRINGKGQVIEKRAEADKHSDHSVGVAFLVVA